MNRYRIVAWLIFIIVGSIIIAGCAGPSTPTVVTAPTSEATSAALPGATATLPSRGATGPAAPSATLSPPTATVPVTATLPPAQSTPEANAADEAVAYLANALSIDPLAVTLVSVEAAQWPDACLGVDMPGQTCATQIVDGYRVVLEAESQQFEIRTNGDASLIAPALALTWSRMGGIAGFCDELAIDVIGQATAYSCKAPYSGEIGMTLLATSDRQQLYQWLNTLTETEIVQADQATADQMTIKASLFGNGTTEATDTVKADILAFAANAFLQVRGGNGGPELQGAIQYLASQLSIDPKSVSLVSEEPVQWPDTCLGVQLPGVACAFHVVDGYRIVLTAEGQQFELHTNADGSSVVATLGLAWHREGGTPAACDRLTIDVIGDATAYTCLGRPPTAVLTRLLTTDQRQEYYNWLNMFTTVEISQTVPVTASAPLIELSLFGTGTTEATSAQETDIATFASDVFGQLLAAGAATATPTPSAAPGATDIVSGTVTAFLNSLMADPTGQQSLAYLTDALTAFVGNAGGVPTALEIQATFRSFGLNTVVIAPDGTRAYAAATLNVVSPLARSFGLYKVDGAWKIGTFIVYGEPFNAIPEGTTDADNVLLDFAWALQTDDPTLAASYMTAYAKTVTTQADLDAMAQSVQSIYGVAIKQVSVIGLDIVYWIVFEATPKAGVSGPWSSGDNTIWFRMTLGSEGWLIEMISASEIVE